MAWLRRVSICHPPLREYANPYSYPVAVQLAGGSELEHVTAGKPDRYRKSASEPFVSDTTQVSNAATHKKAPHHCGALG
jgi:hypothetical protein